MMELTMRYIYVFSLATVLCLGSNALAADKSYGKEVTLSESTSILAINTAPADFSDKPVLVQGKVISMCMHQGCWVMVEAEDKAQILCRSLDESIKFPTTTLNQMVRVQGKLLYDKSAPGMEMKAHEGEEAHACPNPQVMVSIEGAVVETAPVAEPAVEVAPVESPKAEAAPEVEPKSETSPEAETQSK
jgi:hypothetical protein